MKFSGIIQLAVACLFLGAAGCAKKIKPKVEITSLQRKEAATLVSEAQFALSLRDYPRAEGLFVKATTLCPDTGEFWVSLASTQVKLGKRPEAKKAYESAFETYGVQAKGNDKDKPDSESAIQQVAVLALLGRVDDARALLEKLPARFPGDRNVRAFIDAKQLDSMLADPRFKESML